MARRSARLRGAAGGASSETAHSSSSNAGSTVQLSGGEKRKAPDSDTAKPEKPAKRRAGKSNSIRGSLKSIPEMPYDILSEVFSCLEPIDLYRLSRADRSFHALLLNRNFAQPLWKAAFERADLPVCPPDLILPAYAELVYGKACYYCRSTKEFLTAWECCVRVCEKCFTREFVAVPKKHLVLLDIMPECVKPNTKKHMALKVDYDREVGVMESMEEDNGQWTKYLEDGRKRLLPRKDLSLDMEERLLRERKQKEREAGNIYRERMQAIYAKLSDLGYGDTTLDICTVPGVDICRPLTTREWERLSPKIIAKCRSRLIKDRTNFGFYPVYERYLATRQNKKRIAPRYTELARMEPLRTVIYDTPPSHQVTEADFRPYIGMLPNMSDAWRGNAVSALLLIWQEGSGYSKTSRAAEEKEEPLSVLQRAATVFMCKKCTIPTRFPNILSHECLFDNDTRNDDPNPFWNQGGNRVVYNSTVAEGAKAIITALGKDPETATVKEMDDHDRRVECLKCRAGHSDRQLTFMTWRDAMIHDWKVDGHTGNRGSTEGWKIAERRC
ncbi:hypothetical protein NMY22_g18528 [Coprinellus aureogranulatus]|nr:hypothetical protein NMY22_g18528 [Coprinellus aureogranulatus]